MTGMYTGRLVYPVYTRKREGGVHSQVSLFHHTREATMRLRIPLNHGRKGVICASGPSQPWEKEGYMRLRVPLNHGEKGGICASGSSPP